MKVIWVGPPQVHGEAGELVPGQPVEVRPEIAAAWVEQGVAVVEAGPVNAPIAEQEE